MTRELLLWPCVFFSELLETISDNLPILQESPLLSMRTKPILRQLQQLEHKLSPFSLKDGPIELTEK